MTEETRGIPYADQCIVVEGIDHFSSLKGLKLSKSYKHFGMLGTSKTISSAMFLNLLTSKVNGQILLENIPKSLFADLNPYVRIYKEYKVGESRDSVKILLPFGTLGNVGEPRKPKLGVALKSFTFDYLGTHPGEIDYYIGCSLKLYFESTKALFEPRVAYPNRGKSHTYSFADLIDRTPLLPHKGTEAHKQWNPKAFQIRAEVGYEPPSRNRVIEAIKAGRYANQMQQLDYNVYADSIRKAIASAKNSFYLVIKKHTFKPLTNSPAGDFELTIEYNGAIEQSLLTAGADVLKNDPSPEIAKQLDRLMENEYSVRKILSEQKILTPENTQMVADINKEMDLLERNLPTEIQGKATGAEFGQSLHDAMEKSGAAKSTAWVGAQGQDLGTMGIHGASSAMLVNNTLVTAENYPEMRVIMLKNYQTHLIKQGIARKKASGQNYWGLDVMADLFVSDMDESSAFYKQWQESKIEETRGYLETLKEQQNFEATHRASREMRLSDAYNMWVRKLSEQGLIYTYMLDSRLVANWQARRVKRISALSEKEKKKLQKQLNAEETKASDKLDIANKIRNDKDRITNSKALIDSLVAGKKIATFKVEGRSNKELDSAVDSQTRRNRGVRDSKESTFGQKKLPTDGEPTYALNWVYFGDILDATLDFIVSNRHKVGLDLWSSTENSGGKVKILVGDYEYIDPVSFSPKRINIADIPISLDLWNEFVNKAMVSQLKEKYPFKVFLKDLLTNLVQGALTNKCKMPGQPTLNSRFAVDYITVPDARKFNFRQRKGESKDSSWYYKHDQVLSLREIGDPDVNKASKKHEGDIIYIFSTDSSALEAMRGNKAIDNNNGIYHLVLGQEGTPVLDVDFTRSDQPHFLTSKAEKEGLLKGSEFLSEPYHCNLTLYGNTEVRPGKYLYIRFAENYMSTREAQRLGIGGYFFIVKTSSEITQVNSVLHWTTKMECRWEKPLGGKYLLSKNASASTPVSTEEDLYDFAVGLGENPLSKQ